MTIKIDEDRFYRTKSGDVIGPMKRVIFKGRVNVPDEIMFRSRDGDEYWHEDGDACRIKGMFDHRDLVVQVGIIG